MSISDVIRGQGKMNHDIWETTMTRIAIVEDDAPVCNLFADWLKMMDSQFVVDKFGSRHDAERAFATQRYDLVLMDIELNGDQNAGVALIRQLLKKSSCPVIVISGMPADVYRGIMIELAWDYLQKPADKASLQALVRSALKEHPVAFEIGMDGTAVPMPKGLKINPFKDPHPTWQGKRLLIPMTAQRFLFKLASNAGHPVTIAELRELMPFQGSDGAVKTHINTLRSAFTDVDPQFKKIVTIPLVGYIWQD
jgi:DNA-binding response OmpR family regulator